MDSTRRTLLTTGAAAVAAASAPRTFAQATDKGATGKPFYQKGDVRIHYQDVGSGFPLLIIPGGGQNSTIAWSVNNAPFNATEELKSEYRCITADLRNAPSGLSTGPLEIDRPWDSYTDDHLGLMDHLGIKRFMVLGFCIGGPFIWNLVKRAPDRIVAAVVSQPVGFRKESPTLAYDSYMKGWGPELTKQRPDLTMEMTDRFLKSMYGGNRADFVHSVPRDAVRACQSPVLVMPDDSPPHPYVIAIESAMLAPKSEVSMYPWKDTKDKIPLAVRQVRTFLRAYRPAMA
jgi:pimeloyl-ACP methyl ester carboxylesterase